MAFQFNAKAWQVLKVFSD